MLELRSNGWQSGPIFFAASFRQRWRGLRPAPRDHGLLLAARSVHGWGMRVPIWAVAIDRDMEVVSVARLRPGRILFEPGAHFFLELPIDRPPPSPGMQLAI